MHDASSIRALLARRLDVATLLLNGKPVHGSVDALQARIRSLVLRSHHEVWAEVDEGASLCALIDGERGWLMYLRHPGDAGCSSRNPKGGEGLLTCRLSNGQVDHYPASWAYDEAVLKQAFISFLESGERPPNIRWDDGSDTDRLATSPARAKDVS